MVVIGLSLLPVINTFADEITYEPVETAFVDGAILPATETFGDFMDNVAL